MNSHKKIFHGFKIIFPINLILSLLLIPVKAEETQNEQGNLSTQNYINTDSQQRALDFLQEGIQSYNLGNLEAALQSFKTSLSFYEKLSNVSTQAGLWGNIGIIYRELGKYSESIESLNMALAIQQEMNNRYEEGIILESLANTYQNLGDFEEAIKKYQKALLISTELSDSEGKSTIFANIGTAYLNLENFEQSIEYYQQSLEIKHNPEVIHNIGLVYQAQGNVQKAIEYYEQSLNIAQSRHDKLLEQTALGSLGIAYRSLGDNELALEYFEKSLIIARFINNPANIAKMLNNIGASKATLYQFSEAENVLKEAIQIYNSLQNTLNDKNRVSLRDTIMSYQLLQKVLVSQGKTNEALITSENSRARAFISLLSNKLNQNKLESYVTDINQLKKIAQQQNATIVEYSLVADDNQFFLGNSRGTSAKMFIWVIPPDGKIIWREVDIRGIGSIEKLVESSRSSMGIESRGYGRTKLQPSLNQNLDLQQLYQILIKPIEDLLPINPENKVIFIPHESLFLVPFPALKDLEGKYLVEKHTILTSPAIQLLEFTRQQQDIIKSKNLKKILIVGNPDMPSINNEANEKLPPLFGAEEEAIMLGELLNTSVLINEQATEEYIKQNLSQSKIIHLATHGLLDDFNGDGVLGAIALTPSDRDDGLLTANEIIELDLSADLVVLSACNTGRGKITGDGVIGLSRSFIAAGTSSIIVSLWSVPDAPTEFLMTEFYKHLRDGDNKAISLRKAMMTTMKKHPDPKDWAAFTLIGESQ